MTLEATADDSKENKEPRRVPGLSPLKGSHPMPWTSNDAERHTRKANTSELKELWAKVANDSLERTAMRAAPFGKPTL